MSSNDDGARDARGDDGNAARDADDAGGDASDDGGESAAPIDDGSFTLKFLISPSAAGSVIGKGGRRSTSFRRSRGRAFSCRGIARCFRGRMIAW
jgi:hypothetical protein